MKNKFNFKSIILTLTLLTLGVGQMGASSITSDGDIYLFFNMGYWDWWNCGTSGSQNFAYFWGDSGNKWSGRATQVSGNYYAIKVPEGTWGSMILVRNKDTSADWDNYNQSNDITLDNTKNYLSAFKVNNQDNTGKSNTWSTYKPSSSASLSATSTSITTAETSTLTPSLSSNSTYNKIASTSYSVTTNPGSAGSVTSGGVFSATAAGTYTVTATVTYYPKGFSSLTSTTTATKSITVTSASTATLTYHANWYTTGTSGSVPAAQTVAVDATATVAGKNTLAMTNYTFSGWNTEEYITGTDYAVGSSITMDEDKDLYAKWTRSITLDQNGATTNGTTSVTGTYNCSTLPSITNPEKLGYTFVGWRTENNGTGNLVINTSGQLQSNVYHWTDQTTPSNRFQRNPSSTSPLYATWTQDITLNANTDHHGSGSNTTATVTYNSTAVTSITHCTPAAGYKVEGYYTATTDGTKILNADGTFAASSITNYITSSKWTKAGATTLYAHYEPKTTVRLYYSNPDNWSTVYAYVWENADGNNKNNTWHGVNITGNTLVRNGDTYYYYEYYKEDHPNWDRVIFNNNDNNQTNNITFSNTTNNGQYNDAVKDGFGSWHDMPAEETLYSVTLYAGDHGAINAKGTAIAKNSNSTVNIGTNSPISATPESGYSFDKWVTTGSVTVTDPYSASTTVSASAAGGTVTATYLQNSGWCMVGNPFDNSWTTTNYPMDRSYRGISGAYYRLWTISTSDQYYKVAYNGTQYGQKDAGDDVAVVTGTQYSLVATEAYNTAFKTNNNGSVWCVVDDSNKKFWVQSPTTYYTVTVSSDHGTVKLKEKSYGGLETNQFANSETIRVEIDTVAHYSINTVTLSWGVSSSTTVSMSKSGTKYVGDVVMPNSDATLTVTYTPWYTIHYEKVPTAGGKTAPWANTSGNINDKTITSDATYVISGTTVYLYAANKSDGYTYYGWYSVNNPSKDDTSKRLTNRQDYSTSITTSGKEFYAIYFENDYEVTVNAGTGGKVNSLSSTSITGHVTSLANLPTATADPGYYFVNWTTTAGTLTNSTSATNGKINGLTSTATVTANFAPIWTIAGLGGDWNTNKLPLATMYVYDAVNYAYLDIDTLRPNTTYYFKAIQRSQGDPVWWHAENTTDNKDIYYSNSNTRINMSSSDGDNFYLHTAGTGTYTFDVNLDGSKHPIKVHFPTSYTVTFGSAHGTVTATVEDASAITSGQYAAAGKDITFAQTPATGYTFKGWYNAESGGTAISCMASDNVYDDIAGNISVYAQYDPKTYDVTLTNSGTGYSSGGQAKLTATYDAAFPSITLPTAANGYAFMGYWSAANGEGTQFTNASGVLLANITDYSDESGHWKYDASDLTLYAYYKKAEITEITLNQSIFEPVASGTSYVKAEPTIEPTPEAPTKICWELLYDNDNPVTSHYAEDDSEVGHENRVKFNLAGLAAGSYRIRATLYTGTECSGGTLLSTYDKTVTIANEFTVTVKYMCGTEEIQASTTTPGKATQWTSISAPDIFGYTFDRWDLGDGGITKHESDAITKQSDFRFKASYNGILTAKYTKNKYIYLDLSNTFSSSGQWNNPYCYLYNSDGYWDDSKGAGATGPNCVKKGAMTQIGSTNIWYYDYSDASTFVDKLAFTWGDKGTYDNFCEDAIYRSDFSEGTPLFIPAVGQTGVKKNSDCATYYNAGYWTNYTGSKTGYTLLIYNSSGTGDPIKTRLFTSTSNDMRMTMKATVDLEAATTYKVEILRDNGHYYKNSDERNYGNSQVNKKYLESGTKGNIVTTAAGDYVFTLSYTDNSSDKDFQIRMIVDYPAAVNDFQVMYNDNATWSLGTAHTEGWRHPSRMIKARAGGVDTISFFVGKTNSPKLYARKVTNASSLTWASLNIAGAASMSLSVDSSAVYNFKVTQSTAGVIASIENIGAYTGEYYIRCDAVNSKWDNYTTDDDHRMTYSSFSESDANAFGEKYSHYKAKWCKYGKNVKFVIANDYSPCISDTLVQDVPDTYGNINEDGFLKDDGTAEETENRYSANIRFMWNRKTNKISRAYVASSTNTSRLFLVLRGNTAIKGLDDSPIEDEGSEIPSVILQDDQNWIYEEVLYIKPNTRFKLYACYAQVTASPNGAQYFRGTYNGNAFSGEDGKDSENSVVLIGGSGETYQKARVLYDFKTNRLICAWLPSSSAIDEEIGINADVMVIREHHEPAQYISFKDEDSKLTGVKTVYGVMKFNRWVLNNRKQTGTHGPLDVGNQKSIYERSLYFVSFPFDVRVGDIFGFGRYWDEWYLEYYDGLNRAKNGFWLDSPPNWKYVTPEMATDYVLKANVGYILGLDLDFMAYDNTTFWAHDIETIELFFPSTVAQETLQQVNCTIPALSAIEGDPYRCTINRGDGTEGDRRVKDSYWHCMGVPSFNIYNTPLKDASGTAITWQPSGNTLPFIYMWNKADNTLTAQSTSTFTFLPMHAYLVQNGGEIRWENVSAKGPSSIVARRVNEQPVKEYEWRLALMSDTNLIDQTYVKMSNLEQVTDTFDFNQDLIKEFNKTRSNIYSYIGYEQVAANSMPLQTEQTTVIPVGVKIKTAGEYTFAMPDGTNGVGVTLIDTETGVRTSLGLMDYTVTLTAGLFNQRFFLEISPVSNTPTDIELINDENDENGENGVTGARKVLIDNKLFIITEDGKVFDARGAMVKSNE